MSWSLSRRVGLGTELAKAAMSIACLEPPECEVAAFKDDGRSPLHEPPFRVMLNRMVYFPFDCHAFRAVR